jgi:hypothetical protein
LEYKAIVNGIADAVSQRIDKDFTSNINELKKSKDYMVALIDQYMNSLSASKQLSEFIERIQEDALDLLQPVGVPKYTSESGYSKGIVDKASVLTKKATDLKDKASNINGVGILDYVTEAMSEASAKGHKIVKIFDDASKIVDAYSEYKNGNKTREDMIKGIEQYGGVKLSSATFKPSVVTTDPTKKLPTLTSAPPTTPSLPSTPSTLPSAPPTTPSLPSPPRGTGGPPTVVRRVIPRAARGTLEQDEESRKRREQSIGTGSLISFGTAGDTKSVVKYYTGRSSPGALRVFSTKHLSGSVISRQMRDGTFLPNVDIVVSIHSQADYALGGVNPFSDKSALTIVARGAVPLVFSRNVGDLGFDHFYGIWRSGGGRFGGAKEVTVKRGKYKGDPRGDVTYSLDTTIFSIGEIVISMNDLSGAAPPNLLDENVVIQYDVKFSDPSLNKALIVFDDVYGGGGGGLKYSVAIGMNKKSGPFYELEYMLIGVKI